MKSSLEKTEDSLLEENKYTALMDPLSARVAIWYRENSILLCSRGWEHSAWHAKCGLRVWIAGLAADFILSCTPPTITAVRLPTIIDYGV